MRKIIFAVFAIALFVQIPLQAAYLSNVPQTLKQPDGKVLQCFATGDEYHNWLHDAGNYTIIRDHSTGYYVYATKSGNRLVPTGFIAGRTDPAAAGLQPGLNLEPAEVSRLVKEKFHTPSLKGLNSSNTIGSFNNIVIFIRFSDQDEFTSFTTTYNNAFNASSGVSMAEYFKEVSSSQLSITTSFYPATGGTTVVSYQDSHARDYYLEYDATTNTIGYTSEDERTTREMTLLRDATLAVKAEIEATGLDFDLNNDGKIDNVCYIIKGAVAGWNDLLWPHMWVLYSFNVQVAGAQVSNFNFQLSESFGVSVLCHEMSHSLGFPDLYHYTTSDITPVGQWDLMASNTSPPQHQSAYGKQKYGKWFSGLTTISTAGTYTLAPLSANPFAGYKIASPNSSSEFFVVEYRKASGTFESALPGSGLIISRVNSSIEGNSEGPPDEVYVFRPNGTTTVNGSLSSAFFSAASGRTSFTATSNPACFLSNGSAGGIEITNISAAGETITFTLGYPAATPILTVAPLSQNVVAAGASTTFAVSNTGAGSMAWTAAVATEASSWLHITSGGTGTNAGTITVLADANTGSGSRTGTITVTATGATGSPKTVNVIQAGSPAVLSVTPVSRSIGATGGSTTFEVSNTGGGTMSWAASVTTGSDWVHINSGASGSNSGTISVSVDASSDPAIRTGVITITATGATGSPKTVTIEQAGVSTILSVTPDTQNAGYSAGSTSFAVSNTGGGTMNWTATVTTGSDWIHLTSGASGSNSGTIGVTYDTNPDNGPRTGVITVNAAGAAGSPKTVTVVQSASPPILTVLPATRSVDYNNGSTTFAVTNTGGGTMAWSAAITTGSDWIRINSGTSGSNSGTISVSYDANTENDTRTGVITITAAGATGSPKTVTLVQAANPPVLTVLPATRSVDYNNGSTTFAVSNTGGGTMAWSAAVTTGSSWLRINSGTSGSNSGTISVTYDANNENDIRTGVITITAAGVTGSPKTVTLEQAVQGSVLNVTPDIQNVAFGSGTTNFAVTNTGGGNMAWTAAVTTGSSWAHISSGTSGSNSGTISVSYDANPDNEVRMGVITVTAAGATGTPKSVAVLQARNSPVLTIEPSSRTIDYFAGQASFEVSNAGGGTMAWTAQIPAEISWARISSGSTGSNTGTITVSIDQNETAVERTVEMVVSIDGDSGSVQTVTVTQRGDLSGIDQSKAESGFQVYPNPANDQVTVKVTDAHGYEHQLEVLNILGRLEMVQTLTQESTVIDMSKMAKGVYFFRVTSKNQTPGMIKVIRD